MENPEKSVKTCLARVAHDALVQGEGVCVCLRRRDEVSEGETVKE